MVKPFYISDDIWETLKHKEQDFIILVHSRKYTKAQIMRKLYLDNRTSYWKLQKRVIEKIKCDVEKVNEVNKNN